MISRRGLLRGLLATPAIIRTPGLLMPVRPIGVPVSGKFYFEVPRPVSGSWLTKTPDDDVNNIFSTSWDTCVPDWQLVFEEGNLRTMPTGFTSF